MNEQTTSAAELDALPVGSVVGWESFATYIFVKTFIGAWVGAGSERPWSSEELLTHVPAVLYRPDQPHPDPGEVEALRAEVAALKARIADMSWGLNPDRMGQ